MEEKRLFLVFLIVVAVILFIYMWCNRYKWLGVTDRESIRKLYQMMLDVDAVFDEGGLTYWGIYGTALGVERHGGIIPWDDDIDIGILKEDEGKLLSLVPQLKEVGYELEKHWIGYKIKYIGQEFPFIDIFIFEKSADADVYVPVSSKVRRIWPKSNIHGLFPLERKQFGNDLKIPVPRGVRRYIADTYGDDWNDVAYRTYNHKLETWVPPIKVKLTPDMRKPATF